VFAIPFASLDETLAHLQPELRVLVEGLCERGPEALRGDAKRLARFARPSRNHEFGQANDNRRLAPAA
jgi:hypothetical protein